ncbi:DUF1642 domain-containing protein [Enterococcus faecalis]|uniref:DUF1642 domain-containing protein n=1 Tax=Enterococcus faecalis TaxID=1351 RepID=UPI002A366355|nr:DUF1642 domain-containing protein [Enterococcus faecalis]
MHELIKEIERQLEMDRIEEGNMSAEDVLYIVKGFKRPYLDEPKKVVFSHKEKFVADWLDGLKGRISDKKLSSGAAFMVFVGQQLECLYYNEYTLITDDVEGWLLHPENKVKLLNAIDNGYEIEKEQ